MIKFNFRLSVKNNLGLFWFRFTLHWNWFELSVCTGVKTMGLNVWVGGLMRDTP